MKIRYQVSGIRYWVDKVLLMIFMASVPLVLSACSLQFAGGGGGPKTEEFAQGKVVKGFPTSMPLYKNAQIVESYGGSGGYGASFIANDNLAKVVNFYNQSLPALGWTVTPRQVSENNYTFEIKNEKDSGRVIVNTASDGKKTAISMSIAGR